MDIGSILGGTGAALLGLVAGVVKERTGREATFNARVDKELVEMRTEVALCRAERTEFAIVKLGVTMVVTEFQRLHPLNPVLQAVAAAWSHLPAEEGEFGALLAQLDAGQKDADETAPSSPDA